MSSDKICNLRRAVTEKLGEYRANHVLAVEEEAAKLAAIFLPEMETNVRISALLHDITKEYTTEMQLQLLCEFGIILDSVTAKCPKVFHSVTAPCVIRRDFPEFADDAILSAIQKHTAGSSDMSIFDCIIYLADYIEPTRTFEDCKKLRKFFWDGISSCSSEEEKIIHLYKTMVMSFDLTINNLISDHCVISPDTFSARNAFLMKLSEEK